MLAVVRHQTFYEAIVQIIPVLILVLVIEGRVLAPRTGRLIVGIGTALFFLAVTAEVAALRQLWIADEKGRVLTEQAETLTAWVCWIALAALSVAIVLVGRFGAEELWPRRAPVESSGRK
jgi:hypothetical protein